EYSDLDYLQDFERGAGQQRRPYVYSNAYLSRNFGPHSLNILVDQRERVLKHPSEDIRRQIPEVEYRLRKLRLGKSQIYLDLQSSLHYFSLDLQTTPSGVSEPERFTEQYGRIDVSPTLSIPLSSLTWLSAEVELGGRATYYTDSLTPLEVVEETGEARWFAGEDLDRAFPRAGLDVIGPSILRIFDQKIGRFAKFKHIVEPRIQYSFVGDFDRQDDIFRFDEIDNLSPTNGFLFQLVNRLVAKPADAEQGGAIEIASLTFSQGYSNDEDRPGQRSRFTVSNPLSQEPQPLAETAEGPFGVALRINPSRATSFRLDAGFNTLFGGYRLQSFRLSGSTKVGRHIFGLSWFSNWSVDFDPAELESDPIPVLSTQTSEQAQFSGKLNLWPERLSLEAQLSFDVLGPADPVTNERNNAWDLQQQRYFLSWKSQCYSWQLEYRESNYRDIEDRDVRFSLTLKNVGTFLDLNDSF
ncbi:MAG: LPS-assembly protein LptD, partial [bacterium]|nr:LPS-assembly protein LptD [bacterium]